MKIYRQLAILFAICLAGSGLSALLPFPFPASVAAMLLLLIFFALGLLKVESVAESADFFLSTMAMLFIPSTVGLLESLGAIKDILLPLVIICIVCTVFTFLAAAGAASLVIRLQQGGKKGGQDHG